MTIRKTKSVKAGSIGSFKWNAEFTVYVEDDLSKRCCYHSLSQIHIVVWGYGQEGSMFEDDMA